MSETEQNPEASPETEADIAEAVEAASDLGTAALEAEIAELKDRLLRQMAETENLRRRAEREKADASAYGVTQFARDMLSIADNLRRTLDAATDEARADERMGAFITGCEMTERELLNSFERHGIRKVSPEKGERFDPNLHQAMFEVEDATLPTGSVVQSIQAGFVIKDRLLRPALVGVAKGGTSRVDTSA